MNDISTHTQTPQYVTAEVIQKQSEEMWSKHACWFQAEIAEYLLRQPRRNLVSTAATGTGKTYTFFLPALYECGVTFIVIPLKKLRNQHQQSAEALSFSAVALEAATINKSVIKASCRRHIIHQFAHLMTRISEQ